MKQIVGPRLFELMMRMNVVVVLATFLMHVGYMQPALPENGDHHARLHVLEQETGAVSGLPLRLERDPGQSFCFTAISTDPCNSRTAPERPAPFMLDTADFEPLASHLALSQITSAYL
jgi:hypothetical protein